MPPHHASSLTGARGARVTCGARGNCEEGDDDDHYESVMEGEVNAPG